MLYHITDNGVEECFGDCYLGVEDHYYDLDDALIVHEYRVEFVEDEVDSYEKDYDYFEGQIALKLEEWNEAKSVWGEALGVHYEAKSDSLSVPSAENMKKELLAKDLLSKTVWSESNALGEYEAALREQFWFVKDYDEYVFGDSDGNIISVGIDWEELGEYGVFNTEGRVYSGYDVKAMKKADYEALVKSGEYFRFMGFNIF